MKIKNNEITTDYSPDERGMFGFDCINIDIKNASFGSLRMLQSDLDKLAEEWRVNNEECGHPVSSSYVDLLRKLSNDLKEKLK
jgi:hypothetical protein